MHALLQRTVLLVGMMAALALLAGGVVALGELHAAVAERIASVPAEAGSAALFEPLLEP